MQIFEWIKSKLETRPAPFEWTDPAEGTNGVAILREGSQALEVLKKPEQAPRFALVSCATAQAMVVYLHRHAEKERSIVFANEKGLHGITDYTIGTWLEPDRRTARVTMPADWSADCKAAMAEVERLTGKWISLDDMEALLDVAAPFIKEVAGLRDVLLNLEGSEVVSARRTATGSSVQTGSNVQAKGEQKIPGEIELGGVFMGQVVTMRLPLRVRAKANALEFHLVDNGAVRIAKARAVTQAAEYVRTSGWFVVEGALA